jgi:hypothetical protein
LDSLYDDADDLMNDENEMTILEWLLKASFRWVNRGMDRVDPLLTTAQRSRFVKLLEASNQTIDQTLDAFYASAFPCQGGLLVRELQFAVAGELAALRRDNLRLLALMRRTDS